MSTEDAIKSALKLHHQGELTKACEIYQDVLAEDTHNVDALKFIGIAKAQQGDFTKALEYLTQAAMITPDDAAIQNNIANVYKHLNNNQQAIQHYQNAIKLDPESAEAQNNLANLYLKQNDFANALGHYHKAITLNPAHIEAHFNLALLFLKQHNLDAAMTEFRNVLRLNPDNALAMKNLADLYLQTEQYADAATLYRQSIRLQPDYKEAINNLGVTLLKQGEAEAAIQAFIDIIKHDESDIEARNNLAAIYLQQDRYENAARNYQELLRYVPDDLEAHYNLGVAQMAIGEIESAAKHFHFVLEDDPNHFDARCNLAVIFLKRDNKVEAAKQYRLAHELRPHDETVNFMLAALTQEATPDTAPSEYVQHLFDNYAVYYEKHVAEVLHYKVPDLMRNAIIKIRNQTGIKAKWRILDLGCGTGLSGDIFSDMSDYMVGVDLSAKMIAKASLRNIYQDLMVTDVVTYVKSTMDKFDLVLAADVVVYMGDLAELFKEVHRLLNDVGLFSFNIEKQTAIETGDYHLRATARYSHSKTYIEKLAASNGFEILVADEIVPRIQEGKPLAGYLFVLRRVLKTPSSRT